LTSRASRRHRSYLWSCTSGSLQQPAHETRG
jgi:hypothetical protein